MLIEISPTWDWTIVLGLEIDCTTVQKGNSPLRPTAKTSSSGEVKLASNGFRSPQIWFRFILTSCLAKNIVYREAVGVESKLAKVKRCPVWTVLECGIGGR